ncbi:MAG: hypothetical protein IT305_32495 [Chloroflexi bacterium]|nr:hypothetical protein [Chloroflexota bacterium]
MNDLVSEPARPLTDDEEAAARIDAGRQPRTYAPASERVPETPAPGDAEIIEEGRDYQLSPEAARHPGDRSAPEELR